MTSKIDRDSKVEDRPVQRPLKPPSPPNLEGKVVKNYRLIKRVGLGGFGSVYRAEHVELGNPFAVKILHPHLSKNPEIIERFKKEALTLAALRHENIVQVIDVGSEPEIGFFLIMEWLEGKTLYRLWRRRRTFPLPQIYAIFSQLLDALEHAHSKNIVHRDLKSENIIFIRGSLNRSILKIVDFGIAGLIRGEKPPSEELAMGSPHYMAPEQIRKEFDKIDARTDIYACGVILFELLTGRRLFLGENPKELMKKHLEEPPPALLDIPGAVTASPQFQNILDRALAKSPEERFSSAAEMFEALKSAMEEEGCEPDWKILDSRERVSSNIYSALNELNPETKTEDHLTPPDDEELEFSPGPGKKLKLVGIALMLTVLLAFFGISQFSGDSPSQSTGSPSKGADAGVDSGEGGTPTRGGSRKQGPNPSIVPGGAESSSGVDGGGEGSDSSGGPEQKSGSSVKGGNSVKSERGGGLTESGHSQRKAKAKKRRYLRRRNRKYRGSRARRKGKVISKYSLSIVTTPPGARVLVDGQFKGLTPLTLRLPSGKRYRIEVIKSGYVKEKFFWRANRNRRKTIKLVEELF